MAHKLVADDDSEFCPKCGRPTVIRVEQRGFDDQTGKPLLYPKRECSRKLLGLIPIPCRDYSWDY